MEAKLWGGRFAKAADAQMHALNCSLPFDKRLYAEDIAGSQAWARALARAGVLTTTEMETLSAGLAQVLAEFESGDIVLLPSDEDIHSAVERRLTELVGAVGGKLHTGRSRNDQVATDFRLWMRTAFDSIQKEVRNLQGAIVRSAAQQLHVPLPGYTHLQHAQPITWGHWLLSFFWMLERDYERLAQAQARANVSPLGSGALAGCAFPIDRIELAAELGFTTLTANSLDGVSDRDFAADFLYTAALIGIHLSQLAEQLVLYSSSEFGFVRLDDAYATGSSLMPQKKNPDPLELARGKSGRLLGYLVGLLTTLKGLPSSGYDKDLQEDKEPVFAAYDTLALMLPVVAGVIASLKIYPDKMAAQLEPSLLATDLADYLVRRGLPFRQAHHVIGQVVRLAEHHGVALTELSLVDLQSVSDIFDESVLAVFDIQASLASRAVVGGTAPAALLAQLQQAQAILREQLT